MPTVSIGNTDKRINSTKQTFSSAFSADCKLKEPCGMESPVFIVQGLSKGSFYNYASFEGRYFWVDDIIYKTNNIQEVHCHIDPLATYKNDIKNTFALVQYGDSSHWNKWVDDVRFNPEQEETSFADQKNIDTFVGSETGSVILRCMDCGNRMGVCTVALTPASFTSILVDLYAELSPLTLDKIAAKIGGIGSWADNIISCVWVPFSFEQNAVTFSIGSIQVQGTGQFIGVAVHQNQQANVSLDWSWAANNPYLKNSRWCSYQIVTPFGYAELPIEHIVNQSNLYVNTSVIKNTGDIIFSVWESGYGDGTLLASFAGNVSIDLMGMLGNGQNIGSMVANGMGFGAKLGIGAATLGMSLGAGQVAMTMANQQMAAADQYGDASQFASAARNYTDTRANVATQTMNAGYDLATSTPSSLNISAPSGSASAGAASLWITGNFGKGRLVRKVFTQVDYTQYKNFCDMYGYPVNAYMSLSTISGYVKCSGAIVPATGASPASLSTLNSMVNSGIYIE